MNRIVILLFLTIVFTSFSTKPSKIIARQGQVSFFSYTTVENIEDKNNQVLIIVDFYKN